MQTSKLIGKKSAQKLKALKNKGVEKIIGDFASICKPAKITVFDGSKEDMQYARGLAIRNGEEKELAVKGHTIHFDGMNDQGRDKAATKVLLPDGMKISKAINTMEREAGLKEILSIMDGCMKGKEMLVAFFCLGPTDSAFSIPALQLTDSAYVVHSEHMLYRQGYGQFKKLGGKKDFFYFVHSAGEVENGVSKNFEKKRIFIDLAEKRVLSVNNQYAGNSVGLKKLALRLAIKKANEENWLTEHMFIMGVKPKGKNRKTYFMGAFPSACGKTSTAMLPGQTIVGDDIAYIKVDKEGQARAVNIEQGIFGIITDVKQKDDPAIFNAISTPREAIFSNVLVNDSRPYWLGMDRQLPTHGVNFSGAWQGGKKDAEGNQIPAAHKNARYTIRLSELENIDEHADNPGGVPVSAFIYGGRDSDTSVPVAESLNWPHGVFIGACLESETTSATTGKEGQLAHNPMANFDFLTVPLSTYINSHLRFGECLGRQIKVFSTNYFLKENGQYLNGMLDKKAWIMWMEGRVHNEFEAIETPIGFIPKYAGLKEIFKACLGKEYAKEEYVKQFGIRIDKYLEKLSRIEPIFRAEEGIPIVFWQHFKQQKQRLLDAKEKFQKAVVLPQEFEAWHKGNCLYPVRK